MPPFELRACSADDFRITYEITKEAMSLYVEQTWGIWNDEDQALKHRESFTAETHSLVVVSGHVVGLIAVEEEPTHLWLVKLYLLTRHRRNGLGSALLEQVIRQARSSGRLVRLRVLRVNTGAKRFYERHGLKVVE